MNDTMTNQTKTLLFFLSVGICLLLFLVYILFWNSNGAIPRFVEQRVVLATGVSFDSKKLIALDPKTGNEIKPCIPTSSYLPNENNSTRTTDMKKNNDKCETQLNVDSNPVIASALESSRNPIKGQVKNKKGETVDAQYFVTVEAQFKGSDCSTKTSSGRQFENCIPPSDPSGGLDD